MSSQSGASAEALPLPKGGGSTRGLGDGFTPDLNRGTGSYSVEFELPQGCRNLAPKLALTYNTASGDSAFGHGWNLPMPVIQIDTDQGVADYVSPQYLHGGESLVAVGGARYRQRVENSFSRIMRLGSAGDEGWEVTSKDGTVTRMGSTSDSRIVGDVDGVERTYAWWIDSVRDTSGNEIHYHYRRDGNALYVERIDYASFEAHFNYETRDNPPVNRRAGFALTQRLRCHTVELRHVGTNSTVIRRYTLHHNNSPDMPALLDRVTMEGFKRQADGTLEQSSAPPVEFTYTPFDPAQRRFMPVAQDMLQPPGSLGESGRELVDLNGDGLPDVVQLGTGRPRVWKNLGDGRFAEPRTLTDFPHPLVMNTTTALFDADGRGTADVVVLDHNHARYYPNNGQGGFDRPRYLGGREPLAFDFSDPDSAFADVNGDGRVDLVRTTARGLVTWHNRGGDQGFDLPSVASNASHIDATQNQLPAVRLSDPNVFLRDMSGDGLPDIVHVRSGVVEYWPALGGGRYDQRVVMADPPDLPSPVDPSRLYLADVDGSGTSDVIYVGYDEVLLWRNLNGHGFAAAISIPGTPNTTADSVRVVDLLGNGGVGVLWSNVRTGSYRSGYRFLSLTATRPWLLSVAREAGGLDTLIEYGSSSEHASRDTLRDEPWSTRLPMPVQVVNRIIRSDRVTGRSDISEIAYHDGQWDTATRRFRGFGRVTVDRRGGPATRERVEEHHFLVGAPGEPALSAQSTLDTARALRGQNYLSTYFTADVDSPVLRSESNTWQAIDITDGDAVDDGAVPVLFPQVVQTEVRNFEGGDRPRVMTTFYAYDRFGNVTREERQGHAPNGDDAGNPVPEQRVVTEMMYAINESHYVVDHIARTVKRDSTGRVLAELRHYYDGSDLDGLPLGQIEGGLLRRQEEVVLLRADVATLYGSNEPNWTDLGYHEVTRIDGEAALAINQTRYEHTPNGMISKRIDALGAETMFDYDDDEILVVQVTDAAGRVQLASYDLGWQHIDARTDTDGTNTRYHYDALGRLSTVVRHSDSDELPTLQYTYNHTDLPNSVHVEKRRTSGNADSYERVDYHDGFGRMLQTRTRIDETRVRVSEVRQLNDRGEPVSRGQPMIRDGLEYEEPDTLPITPVSNYVYDGIGRLVSASNEAGQTFRVSYSPWSAIHHDMLDDDPGHPHANTPRVEHFDTLGRLSGVTRTGSAGTQHRASYRYDSLGRLIASTDLEERTALREVTHDARGMKLKIDHAVAGVRTSIFDALGRIVRYWDDRGQVVSREYNSDGKLSNVSIDGTTENSYQYEPASGRLSSVSDAGGSVSFRYDKAGRVIGKTRTIDGQSFDVSYEFDASGLTNRIVYPNGEIVDFSRWGDGHIRSVTGLVDEFDYSAAGRLETVHHSNGVDEQLQYSVAGSLESLSITHAGSSLHDAQMIHDPVGRLTQSSIQSNGQSQSEFYEYDALGHITDFTRQVDAETTIYNYEHDADGNLLLADEMAVERFDYDFNTPGALLSRTLAGGATEALNFDAGGHLTNLGDQTFIYDAHGRLSRVERSDGTVIEMVYDYRGARLLKRVSGPGGNYSVRYVDDLYEENAGVATAYVIAAGRLIGMLRGGGRRHLHVDHRGSPILSTRTNGAIDTRGWFGPYGSDAFASTNDSSRHYTGAVFDHETGLHYLNHRYYSAALGRFLTPDPLYLGRPEREIDVPEAHNLFAYANGDPVNYTDPTGQGFWSTLGKVLGAIVVAVAVIVAVAVAVSVLLAAAPLALLGAGIGAVVGGITGGWQGAALGAMMGATIGINISIGGPLGIITALGVFPGIREEGWYKSLAGWSSWLMPASWAGHIMGLGVFLGNGIAHLFGSDNQIESVKFDWKHGQIMTAGGEYGGSPFPWLGIADAQAHNLGGFSFYSNNLWTSGGGTWAGMQDTVEHETGHMLSNALFGFWQGVINGIEHFSGDHDGQFFEKIAESNVNEIDRDDYGREVPIWG